MRIAVLVIAGLVFAAGLLLEPAAVVQIARLCFGGQCGIRPVWLYAGLGVAVAGVALAAALGGRPAPAPVKARPKPGGRPAPKRKAGPRAAGPTAARRARPASRRTR